MQLFAIIYNFTTDDFKAFHLIEDIRYQIIRSNHHIGIELVM